MRHELAELYKIIQTATKLQKDFPNDRSLILTAKQYFSIRRRLLKKNLGLLDTPAKSNNNENKQCE